MKLIQSSKASVKKTSKARPFKAARRQAGITIIEVMASIVFVSILSVGTFNLYGKVAASMKVVQAQTEIAQLTASVIRNYASYGNYSTLTTESAMTEGWLPKEMLDASGHPINAWGNSVDLGHVDMAQPSSAFTISQRLPSDACVTLVSNMARNFDSIQVDSREVSTGRSPADPDLLAKLCGATNAVVLSLTTAR